MVGQELTKPCDQPAILPDKELTTQETARLWGRDRRALGICADRQSGLARAAEAIREEQGN